MEVRALRPSWGLGPHLLTNLSLITSLCNTRNYAPRLDSDAWLCKFQAFIASAGFWALVPNLWPSGWGAGASEGVAGLLGCPPSHPQPPIATILARRQNVSGSGSSVRVSVRCHHCDIRLGVSKGSLSLYLKALNGFGLKNQQINENSDVLAMGGLRLNAQGKRGPQR